MPEAVKGGTGLKSGLCNKVQNTDPGRTGPEEGRTRTEEEFTLRHGAAQADFTYRIFQWLHVVQGQVRGGKRHPPATRKTALRA